MRRRLSTYVPALAMIFCVGAAGSGAAAQSLDPAPPETSEQLASRMEARLATLGAGATPQQDADALKAVISHSNATCAQAEQAIAIARSGETAPNPSTALTRVNASFTNCCPSPTSTAARSRMNLAPGTARSGARNGDCRPWYPSPGRGYATPVAIGAPPAYVGGGGSDYIPR